MKTSQLNKCQSFENQINQKNQEILEIQEDFLSYLAHNEIVVYAALMNGQEGDGTITLKERGVWEFTGKDISTDDNFDFTFSAGEFKLRIQKFGKDYQVTLSESNYESDDYESDNE